MKVRRVLNYFLPRSSLSPSRGGVLLEALPAVHWAVAGRLERNFAFRLAVRALCLVHFPVAAPVSVSVVHCYYLL